MSQQICKEQKRTKITDDELYELFSKRLHVTSGEALSKKFVSTAMTMWSRILVKQDLKQLLFMSDELFGKKTPMESVYKLLHVTQVAQSDHTMIKWLLNTMFDLVYNNVMKPAEMNGLALFPDKGAKGHLGYQISSSVSHDKRCIFFFLWGGGHFFGHVRLLPLWAYKLQLRDKLFHRLESMLPEADVKLIRPPLHHIFQI